MNLKMLRLTILATVALTALTAGTASATTLEAAGSAKNQSVSISGEVNSVLTTFTTTGGLRGNYCFFSHMLGSTFPPYSGASVSGSLAGLSFSGCSEEPVKVDAAGSFSIAWTSGTNGTVTLSGTEVTVPSPFGTLTCKTGGGTDIGTLTGATSSTGHATIHINGAINCGIISSMLWQGTYTVTSPTGFGVTS